MKEELETLFLRNHDTCSVYLVEVKDQELTFSRDYKDQGQSELIDLMKSGVYDLSILFKPTDIEYYNGALRGINFLLIGIDTSSNDEVWKANIAMKGGMVGPKGMSESMAKKIYVRLKSDNIL